MNECIYISMYTGTQVAQHAADLIIRDDNFASIVSAVEVGRNLFGNMKRYWECIVCILYTV